MRRATATTFLTALLLLVAAPAWACGFLVAENGAVRLVRTATLAAYVDGVEHYVTSFEFQGGGAAFGSIVPLPGEPTTVEKAGSWTLQRLAQETQPQPLFAAEAAADTAGGRAEVLQEVAIDALDVTILKGGGDEVLNWANDNGFDLGEGAEELLAFYADRSPYFMAARFDVDRADEFDQGVGDGTPVHLAIPTDDPWVPLKILAFDKPDEGRVEADVYLLTPEEPTLLPAGRPGIQVRYSQPASAALLDDLRSDENSEWVPTASWLTYVRLDVAAGDLDHDLAIDVDGDAPSHVDAFGVVAAAVFDPGPVSEPLPSGVDLGLVTRIALVIAIVVGTTAFATGRAEARREQ
ncbi:MAG: DUF2330 domain-containing protein [Nitriliruptorales bacterium]|nr:DUF2330 domain-containing protein [Nitriliruptorales bacterium]